ncbi:FAD-dependent monooxygenase [Actinokineospora enzanensis]|uniref:FAD-dependent monooxygenase n=1 Tax=Actinokineospora enzanensis TaxID=155975 RepID=UPI00036CF397|nr:FAD-dependent monooxygenase [Actinokineospora enzanensis]
MADHTTDVCVVGAGPAGTTLALLLARSGLDVVLVERSRSLDREFRGEILQPGGQALLDALGVLAPALARGGHPHDRFVLEQNGRRLIDADYRGLPGPYNRLLSIPQPHVLSALLDECAHHPGFTYREGAKVTALVAEDSAVRGVVVREQDGEHTIRASCVVGADGRSSKVRVLAGIDGGRVDAFAQDVLWFKLSGSHGLPTDVRVFRAGGNPVLAYASSGAVQLGWCLPHGAYKELAASGFDELKQRLIAAVPTHAARIAAEITSFRDLTLLDVYAANAREWARDGLLLVGDAAHTFSPIGAQGINLAIQDAVAAHPVLVGVLGKNTGDAVVTAADLDAYVRVRKPDIDRMLKIQTIQSKAMLSTGRVSSVVRPALASVMSRSPLFRLMLDKIAFGNRAIRVRTDLFTADERPAERSA